MGKITTEVSWLTLDPGARKCAEYLDQQQTQITDCCDDTLRAELPKVRAELNKAQESLQALEKEIATTHKELATLRATVTELQKNRPTRTPEK